MLVAMHSVYPSSIADRPTIKFDTSPTCHSVRLRRRLNPSTQQRAATAQPTMTPMLQEALLLKQRILQSRPQKWFAFSLTHMRRVATPPVTIPRTYCGPRTKTLMVCGRMVPYTRNMWENAKRIRLRRRLDAIFEGVVYD